MLRQLGNNEVWGHDQNGKNLTWEICFYMLLHTVFIEQEGEWATLTPEHYDAASHYPNHKLCPHAPTLSAWPPGYVPGILEKKKVMGIF